MLRFLTEEATADQGAAHSAPLSVNAVGGAVLPVWLARKPMLTEAFGAMAALYAMFPDVTRPDVGEKVAFQPLAEGKARTSYVSC